MEKIIEIWESWKPCIDDLGLDATVLNAIEEYNQYRSRDRGEPSDGELRKICYKYLVEVFNDGTKIDRFDADISEYWLPHIDHDVVLRMIKELKGLVNK